MLSENAPQNQLDIISVPVQKASVSVECLLQLQCMIFTIKNNTGLSELVHIRRVLPSEGHLQLVFHFEEIAPDVFEAWQKCLKRKLLRSDLINIGIAFY